MSSHRVKWLELRQQIQKQEPQEGNLEGKRGDNTVIDDISNIL